MLTECYWPLGVYMSAPRTPLAASHTAAWRVQQQSKPIWPFVPVLQSADTCLCVRMLPGIRLCESACVHPAACKCERVCIGEHETLIVSRMMSVSWSSFLNMSFCAGAGTPVSACSFALSPAILSSSPIHTCSWSGRAQHSESAEETRGGAHRGMPWDCRRIWWVHAAKNVASHVASHVAASVQASHQVGSQGRHTPQMWPCQRRQ